MPFIHIKSLPFEKPIDVSDVIVGISNDFARSVEVEVEHITVTWGFMLPGHYASAGRISLYQDDNSHPVLVDLLAPDFNTQPQVETMLLATADSISKRAQVSRRNIFINYRQAQSGMVYDAGEIVQW